MTDRPESFLPRQAKICAVYPGPPSAKSTHSKIINLQGLIREIITDSTEKGLAKSFKSVHCSVTQLLYLYQPKLCHQHVTNCTGNISSLCCRFQMGCTGPGWHILCCCCVVSLQDPKRHNKRVRITLDAEINGSLVRWVKKTKSESLSCKRNNSGGGNSIRTWMFNTYKAGQSFYNIK